MPLFSALAKQGIRMINEKFTYINRAMLKPHDLLKQL